MATNLILYFSSSDAVGSTWKFYELYYDSFKNSNYSYTKQTSYILIQNGSNYYAGVIGGYQYNEDNEKYVKFDDTEYFLPDGVNYEAGQVVTLKDKDGHAPDYTFIYYTTISLIVVNKRLISSSKIKNSY